MNKVDDGENDIIIMMEIVATTLLLLNWKAVAHAKSYDYCQHFYIRITSHKFLRSAQGFSLKIWNKVKHQNALCI